MPLYAPFKLAEDVAAGLAHQGAQFRRCVVDAGEGGGYGVVDAGHHVVLRGADARGELVGGAGDGHFDARCRLGDAVGGIDVLLVERGQHLA